MQNDNLLSVITMWRCICNDCYVIVQFIAIINTFTFISNVLQNDNLIVAFQSYNVAVYLQ